jgi:hypothetical protein
VRAATTVTGNGSDSRGGSGASANDIELDSLLRKLVSAQSCCVVCLGTPFKVARAYTEAGEHPPCSQTV